MLSHHGQLLKAFGSASLMAGGEADGLTVMSVAPVVHIKLMAEKQTRMSRTTLEP